MGKHENMFMEHTVISRTFGFILTLYLYCFHCTLHVEATFKLEVLEECPNGTKINGASNYIMHNARIGGSCQCKFLDDKSPLTSLLRLDNVTGELFVNDRIDREQLCPLPLSFQESPYSDFNKPQECIKTIVIFSKTLNQQVKLDIRILDINDNAPSWNTNILTYKFLESLPNGALPKSVSIKSAYDPDENNNRKIIYSLAPGSHSAFRLVADRKLEPIHNLDREKQSNYSLVLLAVDQGHPSLTGSVTLNIEVIDINDNEPKFSQPIYRLPEPIPEDTPVGSVVLTLNATDADFDKHGQVIYQMSPEENHARIYFDVTKSGQIKIKQKLDYDNVNLPHEITFKVIAMDLATPPYQKSATAEVQLQISDVNDEKPQIKVTFIDTENGIPWIYENMPPSQTIGYVTVTDADYRGNDEVTCQINNRNFSLTQTTDLMTGTQFDRERTPFQKFIITCKDTKGNQDSLHITIKIKDVNDETPVFLKSFSFTLQENSLIGSKIGIVEALDADEGENAKIKYAIDPEFEHKFTIDSQTGQLSSKVEFDRESVAHYTIRVLAIDSGKNPRTGTGTVLLNISDQNDNAPQFTLIDNHFEACENWTINSEVGKVEVRDMDAGDNAKIYLSFLPSEDSKMFSVKMNNGVGHILIRNPLDRETKSIYTLHLKATDISPAGSIESKTSTATVTITVTDANDNKPRFSNTEQFAKILEMADSEPAGKELITVKAEDDDTGVNGQITYSIDSGNEGEFYNIDPASGHIYLFKTLQPISGQKKMITLRVKACDHGWNPQCTVSSTIRVRMVEKKSSDTSHRNEISNSAGHEPIIICLAVIFLILVVATVILVCLIRRKTLFIKRSKKAHAPQPNSDVLSPEELLKRENQIFEGQTLLKGRPYGSRDDLDSIAKKKQYYASHAAGVQTMSALRRGSDSAITLNHRPSSPDYQTLDSLGGAYHTGQQPYYSSGSIMGQPTRFILTENPGVVYNPDQHSYYEIGGPECAAMTSPRVMGGSATLGRRQMSQTMGRNRPPPRIPACDYGTHVFRPIPTVTGETDEHMIESVNPGAYRFESYRTLDRTNTMGKYTYDAYKEASFV